MSGLLPLQPQGPLILEALRLVEGTSTPESALAATPGAELKAVLMAISDQGLLLMLPDGRSLTAAGELPYPAGTELTFRIQPQADGSTQLQPLRANPPPTPALLAPLVQGEAASLLQRLSAPDLPAALLPLKALLERLPAPPSAPNFPSLPAAFAPLAEALGLPPGSPEPAALAQPRPAEGGTLPLPSPAPSFEALAQVLTLRGFPPEPARALALLLLGEPPPEAAPQVPAAAARPSSAPPALPTEAPAPGPEGTAPAPPPPTGQAPQRPGPPALDPDLLRAFGMPEPLLQALLTVAKDSGLPARTAPPASGGSAGTDPDAQLRQLLERLPPPLAQRVLALLTLLPPAGQGQALPRQDPLAQLIRALLPQLQAPGAEASLARTSAREAPGAALMQPSDPATWSRWLKEVTSTLSRPEASPAEAPFHRLQAREGTALFEIPLPWAPESGSLELWAERDAPGPDRPEMQRVLLALNLGRTGELRVALQSGPAGVQAQVVATPEVAADLERILREELGTPSPFPLQFRAASDLPPRPRALAGTGLRALG